MKKINKCNTCDKAYSTKQNLERHKNTKKHKERVNSSG
jgi:hypothetical protein